MAKNNNPTMSKHDMEARVNALKMRLRDTDYKAIKAAEGHPSSDWDTIAAERQAWRDEINELDAAIADAPDDEEPGA